jgi:hypothetical protein
LDLARAVKHCMPPLEIVTVDSMPFLSKQFKKSHRPWRVPVSKPGRSTCPLRLTRTLLRIQNKQFKTT